MNYRNFGNTGLRVSEVGFGAWAIGGPAMAGDIPIGWGDVSDAESVKALHRALDLGINFFDTADFYGLGHSETLLGKELGNRPDVVIATKVGHRLDDDQQIFTDYSKVHILRSCEDSLRRLRREAIDFYQLHTARLPDLEDGACIEAMEQLKKEGKIRHWGLSLNTFAPAPEADWLLERQLGEGFQVVLNLLNQRGLATIRRAGELGYGIIARMPLQFGLLTGKFDKSTRFAPTDHRTFRLPPPLLADLLDALEPVWALAEKYVVPKTSLALSYILSEAGVSTVIPGIKTPAQAEANVDGLVQLEPQDLEWLHGQFEETFDGLVERMK